MSGHGAPTIQASDLDASQLTIAVVAASWHTTIMDGLVAGARRALEEAHTGKVLEVRVPGSFELPVAARRLAESVGVVVRGGTPHFDYVCSAATTGLTDVSVATGTPVGFGVLTCDTEQQGLDRAGLEGSTEDKGYEAAHAAVSTALTLQGLGV